MPILVLSAVALSALCAAIILFRRNITLLGAEERNRVQAAETQRALRDSAEYHRILVETAPYGFTLVDLTGRITRTNREGAALHGYSGPEGMVGVRLLDLVAPDDRRRAERAMSEQVAGRVAGSQHAEYLLLKRDGTAFPAEVSTALLWDLEHEPAALTVVARDISERKAFEDRLRHQALHDALTDLPNRTLLQDRILQTIGDGATSFALFLMDLDRFKEINDTFGHRYGDLLLQQVGPRVQGVLEEPETVARLGGDEFAVLLTGVDEEGATRAAERILRALEEPFELAGYSMVVDASIGITLFPRHGDDADTLLRRADVAMYGAKRADSGFAFYDAEKDEYSPGRLALIGELRRAIEGDQLYLHYQPKVYLKNREVAGVEALVRWQHPERGFVPPDQFIGLAEHTGLIKPLTLWVLNRALEQCHLWQKSGVDMTVAVNLSARNLHDPSLVAGVAELLERWELGPGRLEAELTESAVMADPARARDTLMDLHEMGVRISIDDFGTGHSSLAYLQQLPVDEIKIDRSFLLNLEENDNDRRIVQATVRLGHDLGLMVVAEGVENQVIWDLLADLGCDVAQGYYISRPLPAQECTRWLRERRSG